MFCQLHMVPVQVTAPRKTREGLLGWRRDVATSVTTSCLEYATGSGRVTYILLQALTIPTPATSNLAPFRPPTSTRHAHSHLSTSPRASSHTKCPNLLFVLSVKCTVSLPITYSYTMRLSSSGRRTKNMLCSCACVPSCPSSKFPSSGIEIVDLRGRIVP
jgi:hypothetical protein